MSENEPNDPGNEPAESEQGAEIEQPDTGETLRNIKTLADELGISPGQLKGRLEASQKWEKRAKENAEKAKEYDAYVESQKSEQQKLSAAKDEAERQAADTAAELARMKAAVKHGLSEEDLELLDGVPADQVEARAERIAERLGGKKQSFPDLAQGRGKPGESKPDQNDLIRAAAKR